MSDNGTMIKWAGGIAATVVGGALLAFGTWMASRAVEAGERLERLEERLNDLTEIRSDILEVRSEMRGEILELR